MQGLSGRALRAQLAGYVARIVDREMPDAGRQIRRPASVRGWLRAYAAATATTASWEKIRDAATAGWDVVGSLVRITGNPYRAGLCPGGRGLRGPPANLGTREIDLIVERRDGRVLAIEVKLSTSVGDRDVRHLAWLRDQIGDQLIGSVVLTTGPQAYTRRDGVAVVPLGLLGP